MIERSNKQLNIRRTHVELKLEYFVIYGCYCYRIGCMEAMQSGAEIITYYYCESDLLLVNYFPYGFMMRRMYTNYVSIVKIHAHLQNNLLNDG